MQPSVGAASQPAVTGQPQPTPISFQPAASAGYPRSADKILAAAAAGAGGELAQNLPPKEVISTLTLGNQSHIITEHNLCSFLIYLAIVKPQHNLKS